MSASAPILDVLRLIKDGRDPTWVPLVDGKGSQSRTVGRGLTLSTARRRGLIVHEPDGYKLTWAGHAEIEAADARERRARDRIAAANLMMHAHWEKGYRCHGLWTNDLTQAKRLGRVSIGPAGLWDGKTYHWLLDNPKAPGTVPLAEGVADSLKAAKAAVVAAYLSLPAEAFH